MSGKVRVTFPALDESQPDRVSEFATITDFFGSSDFSSELPIRVEALTDGEWKILPLNIRSDLVDTIPEECRDEFVKLFGAPIVKLGSGMTGDVYKVKYKDKNVAIKIIVTGDPIGELLVNNLLLKATKIVKTEIVYGEQASYLVMPIAKCTLEDRLEDLTYKQKKQVLFDVAYAIYECCLAGIEHRDLGAVNVLMFEDPETTELRAKLSDFGESAVTYPSSLIEDFDDIDSFGMLMFQVLADGKAWPTAGPTISDAIENLVLPPEVSKRERELCLDVLQSVLCEKGDPNKVPRITRVLMHEYFDEQYSNSVEVKSINKALLLYDRKDLQVTNVSTIPKAWELLVALEKFGIEIKNKLTDKRVMLAFTYAFELALVLAKQVPELDISECVNIARVIAKNTFKCEQLTNRFASVNERVARAFALVPSVSMFIDSFLADVSTPIPEEIVTRAQQHAIKLYLTPSVFAEPRDRYTLAVACTKLAIAELGGGDDWLDRYDYEGLDQEVGKLCALLKLIKS